MKTIYLNFPDQATFLSLMPQNFVQEGETGFPLPDGVTAISIIGDVFDDAGNLVPGYHVNALDYVPPSWEQYIINPVTPVRTFTP